MLRPVVVTLESLHMTLHKVEQSADPTQDAAAIAELRRIFLRRIAELEAALALDETPDAEATKTPAPAELFPPESTTERGFDKDGQQGIRHRSVKP
jgi:hypothetical protein